MHSKRTAPFDPKKFLSKIRTGKSLRFYPDGEPIFTQGEDANAVFYLEEGKVRLTVLSPGGKEAVIAILNPGSFFGEGCLAGQVQRTSTATSMEHPCVVRIEKKTMIRLLRENPAFEGSLMAYLLSRNIRIEEDLVDQMFNSSEKRLARILLLLARFGKKSNPEPPVTKISQETLAAMVGTTRSRVSYFMNKFKKLGFIRYDDGLHVRSSLLNVVLRD